MNKVYSHYIYLSTYLKVKNVFLLKQLFHEQGLFSLHLSVYILEGKERSRNWKPQGRRKQLESGATTANQNTAGGLGAL